MVLALRKLIGRGLARTAGQVAMSVLATLIATSIYSGSWRGRPDVVAVTPAPLTSGGKYGIRIEGAEMLPLPEPTRPVLSIVNWALTPPGVAAVVPDPGSVALAPPALDVISSGEARPGRHAARKTGMPAAMPSIRPAPTMAVMPSAMVPVVSSPGADADLGVWARASAAVRQTARSAVDMGDSALMVGGHVLGYLVPALR